MQENEKLPPTVMMDESAPAPEIKPEQMQALAAKLAKMFTQYESDRRQSEQKWVRNLRQYLGIYDPEVEKKLPAERSRAYPRITRVKCVSMLSRIMNLMFPGNERNWELKASPSSDLPPDEVIKVMEDLMRKAEAGGIETEMDDDMVQDAVNLIATERAEAISELIDDQLQEIGGDQTSDYVRLNRRVANSGIKYGLGYVRGPLVRETERTVWQMGPDGRPSAELVKAYKPQYEFMPVWDVYLDMDARTPEESESYFLRLVMSRAQLRKLAARADFIGPGVKRAIKQHPRGNFKAKTFETEIRNLGVKENTLSDKEESGKYEIIVFHGPLNGKILADVGVEVPEDRMQDEISAEVWMVGDIVIKAQMNPWEYLEVNMRQMHTFVFDEDDTSPVGNGIPNVMRDSQMALCAATRMLLDNASVACGPQVEVNLDLLEPDQDTTSVHSFKIWQRYGQGADANVPAIRSINVDSHMSELLQMIELFSNLADQETFVGPATGGDMSKQPSEPMRTAAGASMLRGDAALPFKDIVRNFDAFTQSIIQSLVLFNKKFNPDRMPDGDFNVIARGATSLIAKEIRGTQIDQLAQTLTPEERVYVNEERLVEARFKSRDLDNMLASPDEIKRRLAGRAQEQKKVADAQAELQSAEVRKLVTDAFKNISQGQKNAAAADATAVKSVIDTLAKGVEMDVKEQDSGVRAVNELQNAAATEEQRLSGGLGASGLPASESANGKEPVG